MPNQMIALQSRGAKIIDPTAQTAKFVNMMNMAKQQEAAQRQASLAQQSMDINQAQETRAAELHGPALKKAQLEYVGLVADQFSRDVAKLKDGDIAGAEALRANVVKEIPAWGSYIRPASEWTTEYRTQLMLKGKEIADKTIPDITATKEYAAAGATDAQGNPIPEGTVIDTRVGGFSGAAGSTPLRAGGAATPAPRATPTAPQAEAPAPASVGQYGEAKFVNPESIPLTPYQQEHIREMQSGLGMSQPASFSPNANAAQMTPDVMSRIVNSAFKTGVMAQVDFDQLLASQAPQNKQALMDSFRRANITLQADAPSLADSAMGQEQPMAANPVQTPQSRTANLGGDMPMMRTTEAQYIPVQRRDPNIGALPGSSQVPISRVSAEARAGRPSKQEMYDAEAAKIKAARDAGPAPVTAQQKIARKTEVAQAYSKAQTLIDKAYNPKEGIISIANKIKMLSDDQKEAITGYSNYIPSFRGTTREADTLFGNLKGVVTSLGKDAAAASGAVGNMAVQEWKIAADMIANLDLANMTPRALDAQMDRIIEQVSNATKLAERVYNIQYGDDVKELPAFKLRGTPPARTKTPVAKGGTMISPDIDKILKSRGI